MLQELFALPPLFQLAIFALHGTLVLSVAIVFMVALSRRASDPSSIVPVGPSFAAITSIFAVVVGFHAASIWAHRQNAERAFTQAQSAIYRMDDILSPVGVGAKEIRTVLHQYVEAAVHDEWLELGNKGMSDRAEQAFLGLEIALLKQTGSLPMTTQSQLIGLFGDLSKARTDQLWIGSHHTEGYAWLAVLLLGFMSHLAIGAIHFDKQKAGRLMLCLFAVTTTVTYWCLGIIADPYRDRARINPRVLLKFNIVVDEDEMAAASPGSCGDQPGMIC